MEEDKPKGMILVIGAGDELLHKAEIAALLTEYPGCVVMNPEQAKEYGAALPTKPSNMLEFTFINHKREIFTPPPTRADRRKAARLKKKKP
jgi:hypothetical protein